MYFATPTHHLIFGQQYKGFSKILKGFFVLTHLSIFLFLNSLLAKIGGTGVIF
jgi:hypothetical protein